MRDPVKAEWLVQRSVNQPDDAELLCPAGKYVLDLPPERGTVIQVKLEVMMEYGRRLKYIIGRA